MATIISLENRVDFKAPEHVISLLKNAFFGAEEIDETRPIHAAFVHHFDAPGGCARACLTQQCAALLGVSVESRQHLAAAIECLHNASLVQDDLQDQSLYRRGRESVVRKFGADVALGFADRLITTSFVCLAEIRPSSALPSLIRQVNRAVAETVDGQTCEMSDPLESVSLDSRLIAAKQKSGPLFALALELPLIMAGQEKFLEAAHQAACSFGLGYQILDDLTDQIIDAKNPRNDNLVLSMKSIFPSESAQHKAAQMARQLLKDAIVQADQLPHGSGAPLIDLATRLFPKLDVFDS